ncbi:MAG TPA: tyrosine-type recombinase/integrase [Stellaceae bacterium]|nr:tyrosine-type recombinase/integrase [Stellaceae bacterium]
MLRHKLVRGEQIDGAASAASAEQTFGQFVPTWFDEYVVPNNKPSEQQSKRYILSGSLVPFFGKLPIRQITTRHIEQYKGHVLKTGVSRKTLKNRLLVLRKCLATAHEWLGLAGTPPKIVWPKCEPSETVYLSPEECDVLLSNADGILGEMILTALRTGMRLGELKGLQWSSIDWLNRSITVQYSRNDHTKDLESPKSNRIRHIPMDADVHATLFSRMKATGYVFLDADGQPFNSGRLACLLADAREKAGLRHFSWHTLRHTFASHLAMKGVPMTAVQMLMGHSTITTTMRYAHLAPSTLRSAIELLNPRTALTADLGQPVGNAWLEIQRSEAARKRS